MGGLLIGFASVELGVVTLGFNTDVVCLFCVVLEKIDEQEGVKLFGTIDSRELENAVEILKQREQKVLFHESTKLGRASNLRKSLDWDTSFFTSAGKDLVSKKSGLGNSCCSTSSTTSLESSSSVSVTTSNDSSASCSPSGSASSLKSSSNSRRRADSRKSRLAASSSTSKTPLRCLLGDKIVLKNPSLSTPSLSMSNHCSNDPGKSTRNFKPSGLRMPSPKIGFFDEDAKKNGEANLFPHKSPKILSRMNMASAGQRKKISLGADHVKMGNKVATLGSVSVTTSSASSLKSSSNSRRKADSRKSSLAASGSTSKTPRRCSLGDKIVLENPGLSTPSLSMSNHSSYESPASSIDGWSSESSSTANQSSNCLEASFYTSTSRGACLGNDATQALNFQSFPHDKCLDDQESHQTRFPNLCLEVVRGTANDLAKSTRNFKPSGLRMPSPRIGFFDEDLAMLSTVGRDFLFHFGAQSALPNISGVTNRKRPDKLQTTRILLENGDTELGSVQNGVINPSLNATRRYAAQNQELDKNSSKMSSTSATSRNLPGKTSKGQTDTSPQLCRENCSRSSKVIDGGHNSKKLGLHSSLKAERKITEGILKNEMGGESKRPMTKEHERASMHPLENDPYSLHDNEKENMPSFGDHVNGLNRCLEVIDLNRGVVIELEGKKGCSHSHLGDNFTENDRAPIYSSSFSKEYLFPHQQVSPNMLSKTGPLSLSMTVEFMPSTRTPLADKNSAPM
ncbi:hypothetical protein LOK49_LG11G02031 [Camellia lanceoleosa]|uniref:Uncharacterized protein n=1 Tax=Camellia lanceoleosa TaxID=1840588 RepID=A0ACC0G2S1_9ERIC|nr:hypothetical protein LOK49_LG11G02031 [Camellia lanceoleosa]